MSANQKFLFDNSFEAPLPSGAEAVAPPPPEPEVVEPEITEDDLEQARDEGRREGIDLGREEGRSEAYAGIEQTTQNLLVGLTGRIGELITEQPKLRRVIATEALDAASTIVKKLLPSLEKSEALKEIEAVVSECLERAQDEPRLVVRVSERMLEPVKTRIDALVASEGFEGKIVFLAVEGFGDSDVRVEWADGGAERNVENLWRDIDQILARFLKVPAESLSPPATTPTEMRAPMAAEPPTSTEPTNLPQAEPTAESTQEAPPLVSPVEQMGLAASTDGTSDQNVAEQNPTEQNSTDAASSTAPELTQTPVQPAPVTAGPQEPKHD